MTEKNQNIEIKYRERIKQAESYLRKGYFNSCVSKCGRDIIGPLLKDLINNNNGDRDYKRYYMSVENPKYRKDTLFNRIEYLFKIRIINKDQKDKFHKIRLHSYFDWTLSESNARVVLENTKELIKLDNDS